MFSKLLNAFSWIFLSIALVLSALDIFNLESSFRFSQTLPAYNCARIPGFRVLYASQDWGQVHCNRTMTNEPILVGGAQPSSGISVHAHSWLLFVRDREFLEALFLRGKLGAPDYLRGRPTTVRGRILIDGKVTWESRILKPGEIEQFSVRVKEAKTLELQLRDANDGNNSDEGVWFEPEIFTE